MLGQILLLSKRGLQYIAEGHSEILALTSQNKFVPSWVLC